MFRVTHYEKNQLPIKKLVEDDASSIEEILKNKEERNNLVNFLDLKTMNPMSRIFKLLAESLLVDFDENDKMLYLKWLASPLHEAVLIDLAMKYFEMPREAVGFTKRINILRMLVEFQPEKHDDVRETIAFYYSMMGEHRVAEELLLKLPQTIETRTYLAANSLHAASASPEKIFQYHKELGQGFAKIAPYFRLNTNDKTPDRKLNIGIVIEPLCETHVVYRFMASFLNVDRDQYQLTFYDCTKEPHEATVQSLKKQNHKVLCTNNFSAKKLTQQIRTDKIDILFDLSGYFSIALANSRMAMFAAHPAPVSFTYLSYPNTTGLAEMDFRLVDHVTDPEQKTDPYCTEKLLRFDGPFLCFTPSAIELTSAITVEPPSENSKVISLGVLNDPRKFCEEYLTDLGEMLKRIPNSRLIFQYANMWTNDGNFQHLLKRLEKQTGIPIDELKLRVFRIARSDKRIAMLSKVIDIAVDTYPYNGTATNFDALLACVPIVTRTMKNRHEANVTASILTHLNMPELTSCITSSSEGFIQSVIDLAENVELRRYLRQDGRLRTQLVNSPLCNVNQHSDNLWRFVRQAWQQFCNQNIKEQIKLVNRGYWEALPDDVSSEKLREVSSFDEIYKIGLLAILDNKKETLITAFTSLPRQYHIDIIENLMALNAMQLMNELLRSAAIYDFNDALFKSNAVATLKILLKNEMYLETCKAIGGLHILAMKTINLNKPDIMKILIEEGGLAPVNYIHSAIDCGAFNIVKLLGSLMDENDINSTRNGETPVMVATEYQYHAMVQYFYEQKVDFTIHSIDGRAPIHSAVEQGGMMLQFFVDNKVTLNLQMNIEPYFSPISLAAVKKKPDVVAMLLNAGAQPPTNDEWGKLDRFARRILQDALAKMTDTVGTLFVGVQNDKGNGLVKTEKRNGYVR